MADNVTLPGTGAVVASDDDGTAQHQYVKLEWGADNTQNKVDTASGKPLPVQLRSPTGTDMTGSAGSASAAVVTVQGVASMTPVQIGDNSGSITVDNSGTFAVQATLAAGATNIAKAEDVASADADVGVPAMAVRKATPANTSGTDGDYEMLQMSAGRLWASSDISLAGTAVTGGAGAVASGTPRVTLASDDPAVATLGAVADAAATAGSTGSLSAKMRLMTTQLGTINTTLGSPFQAGGTVVDDTITAQGTALGSTKTSLTGASVTTSNPSYSTGQISPLSMDVIGGLRVTDNTITAQGTALGSTRTSLQGASVTTAAPSYSTGQISPLSLDTAGGLRVSALVAGSAIVGKVGIDQTTPGTTDSVTVKSQGFKSAQTVTRPANTTAYTANDALGASAAAITFSSIAPSGGGEMLIKSTELEIDVSAIPSGMTSFRLYLYNVTPPSALADNAAWDLPSGDRASFMGYVDLGTPVDLGSTLYVRTNAVDVQVTATGTSIFGYLVTNGGFTPAGNSEVYKVTLHAVAL